MLHDRNQHSVNNCGLCCIGLSACRLQVQVVRKRHVADQIADQVPSTNLDRVGVKAANGGRAAGSFLVRHSSHPRGNGGRIVALRAREVLINQLLTCVFQYEDIIRKSKLISIIEKYNIPAGHIKEYLGG